MANTQIGFCINKGEVTDVALELDNKDLTRHMAVFGASGSGKTGFLLSLVEENLLNNIPTILIDIKGDMSNIALQTDPELSDSMNFRLLTPGSSHGEQINIFAGLSKPDRLANSVSSLLKMVGEKNYDPIQSKMHAYLSKILQYMHLHKKGSALDDIIELVMDPPFVSFGALDLDSAIPRRSRAALAAKLNTVFVAPSFQQWREGVAIDVAELLSQDGPKTNVTVFSVAHLVDETERMFAVALLMDEVLSWMRSQQGCGELRAQVIIDECVGIIPPYPANPPTKRPLMTLLKQSRAFGLGLVLASQNTKDMDYKALGNCETWVIGKLSMKRDRESIIEGLTANTPIPKEALEAKIASLAARRFMVVRPKMVLEMYSCDVGCELTGPMTEWDMRKLFEQPEKVGVA